MFFEEHVLVVFLGEGERGFWIIGIFELYEADPAMCVLVAHPDLINYINFLLKIPQYPYNHIISNLTELPSAMATLTLIYLFVINTKVIIYKS